MTATAPSATPLADRAPNPKPGASGDQPEILTGTVLRAISGIYDVQPDQPASQPLYRCTLRDKLRKELVLSESSSRAKRVREVRRLAVVEPVVAGDRVEFASSITSGMV